MHQTGARYTFAGNHLFTNVDPRWGRQADTKSILTIGPPAIPHRNLCVVSTNRIAALKRRGAWRGVAPQTDTIG